MNFKRRKQVLDENIPHISPEELKPTNNKARAHRLFTTAATGHLAAKFIKIHVNFVTTWLH